MPAQLVKDSASVTRVNGLCSVSETRLVLVYLCDLGQVIWRRKWQPTPVFLPGKPHGRRSLVDYSPWGCKESDRTETSLSLSHIYLWASQVAPVVKTLPANIGDKRDTSSICGSGRFPEEKNENPLQYSYLEHPMDRGAWCTTVHGVTKELDLTEWLNTHTP